MEKFIHLSLRMTLATKEKMSRITILDQYVNRYELFVTSIFTHSNGMKAVLKDINIFHVLYKNKEASFFSHIKRISPLNQKRNYETIPIIIAHMNIQNCIIDTNSPRKKCPNTEFFSAPYFLVFGLNMEIYAVNIRIQFEYGRIRTRKTSVFGHFSHSELVLITHLDTFHAVVV